MSASLLNKTAVKRYTLSAVASQRPHLAGKLTRVSSDFLDRVEARVREYILDQIRNTPSTGKTIR